MPKIIDHDQRRRDIVEVTWKLIVEGGIEAATMREIASRAGFANGALKHYFPGKDAIVRGAYEKSLKSLTDDHTIHVAGLRGIKGLERSMRYSLPATEEDATSARVLLSFWERCAFSPALDQEFDEYFTAWKMGMMQYLAEGREDGDIITSTPDDQLTNELIMMSIGATVARVVSPQLFCPELLQAQVTSFIARLRQAD